MARRYEPDDDLDRRLRSALEPPAGQVRRVVGEALGVREGRQRRAQTVAAWATATVVVLLVLAGALLLPNLWPPPAPETVAASRYSLSNRDGLLVVRSLDGGATSLHSGGRSSEPPRGMMLIVRGETRP